MLILLRSRTVGVTANVLAEYQELISNTRTDLEDHLREIDNKLQAFSQQGSIASDEELAERERVQEERDSTKQCLAICAKVSDQIGHVQPHVFEDVSAGQGTQQVIVERSIGPVSAKQRTSRGLMEGK